MGPWGSRELQIGEPVAAVIFSNPRRLAHCSALLTCFLALPAAAAIDPGLGRTVASVLPVRAVAATLGSRFLVPDCVNSSLSSPFSLLLLVLSDFCFCAATLLRAVCRLRLRSVGSCSPCRPRAVRPGGRRRFCRFVLPCAFLFGSGRWFGEGSGVSWFGGALVGVRVGVR